MRILAYYIYYANIQSAEGIVAYESEQQDTEKHPISYLGKALQQRS